MELAGRQTEIDAFDLLVAKTLNGRHERSLVLHGLRGVGKTVLFNEFRRQAERAEFVVVALEGRDADGGGQRRSLASSAAAVMSKGAGMAKMNYRRSKMSEKSGSFLPDRAQ